MFITRQLKGLEDTKSAQFNRYFYLLEVCVHRGSVCFPAQRSERWVTLFSFCPTEYRLGEVLQHLL